MSRRAPLSALRRVALITRDDEQEYPAEQIRARLAEVGAELVEGAGIEGVDLVVALGGDGTVLRALVAYPQAPTLAVNFGRVGFLTQCDRDGLEAVLSRVVRGEYFVEERLALEVRRGEQRARCINEVVWKGIAHISEVSLWVDGYHVHTSRGDGLIVGTPTGTTAYLMSTGAPIVTPGVSCLIANPLNEYSFSSRPLIFPGDASLEVRVEECRAQDLVLVIDGGERLPLEVGERVEVSRAADPTLLVAFEPSYFFRNLRERLRWG